MPRPKIIQPKGPIVNKFFGAEQRSVGFVQELEAVAKEQSVLYFDANSVTSASEVDGIHLDEPQHRILGEAIADEVKQALFRFPPVTARPPVSIMAPVK